MYVVRMSITKTELMMVLLKLSHVVLMVMALQEMLHLILCFFVEVGGLLL